MKPQQTSVEFRDWAVAITLYYAFELGKLQKQREDWYSQECKLTSTLKFDILTTNTDPDPDSGTLDPRIVARIATKI